MIEEHDLLNLADPDSGPPIPPPPLDTVVVRGRRLRRRRHAFRALGAVTAIAGLAGAGLVVRGAESGVPDVAAADHLSTPTVPESTWPSSPPPPTDCETKEAQTAAELWIEAVPQTASDVKTGTVPRTVAELAAWAVAQAGESTPLAPREVPDGMRVLPSWTPNGEEISTATATRWTHPCPGGAPVPADPALVLESDGDVTGRITLNGPLPSPGGGGSEREPVQLRGQEAVFAHTEDPAYGWTDADGWSWWLSSDEDVEGPTVLAVAETLQLDGSPEGDDPVAALAPEDMPEGFEIRWQARGAPTPFGPQFTKWSVVVGDQQAVTRGVVCQLEVEAPVGDSSLDMSTYEGEIVTVNGRDAAWTTLMDQLAVVWEVSPGVRAGASCSLWDESGVQPMDLDSHLRFAESVEPVSANDPRFP